MEEIFLDVEEREELGKNKLQELRRKGYIPAVVYAEGKKAVPIKVSHKQLLQLLHQHGLENIIINLRLGKDKKQKARPCLIKEIQNEPVIGEILHVDFNEISLTKTIKVNIPVTAKGEPIGVKQEGGSLEHILWEIEVECLPTNIPKEFIVEVSALKMNESVHVKDIAIPSGIKVLTDPEAVVLSVAAPIKEEAPPEEVEGEEKQEPEVIKEKKEAPGEEAEGAGEKEEKKEKEKEKEKK